MSRTTLCVLTAAVLAVLAVGVMVLRHQALGNDLHAPAGPNVYKVTMIVTGKSAGDAKLVMACPLDFQRQHIFQEKHDSRELTARALDGRQTDRRQLQWLQRVGAPKGAFQARYEFFCRVDVHHPSSPMTRLGETLYAAPKAGEHILSEPRIDAANEDISELALEATRDLHNPADQARALYRWVDENIDNEPATAAAGPSAIECLHARRGCAAAQSRLLVALCRNRGVPARLVTGLTLGKHNEQKAHVWVEAWVGDYWMPMCPYHRHCGRVPASYLVFGFGDLPLVRGNHQVRNLDYAFLVDHKARAEQPGAEPSLLRSFFVGVSLHRLPPAERHLVEFLLLLPLATLIICVYRNIIGIHGFGTFAPALVGLAFRDLRSLPGILVFVSIVLIGWGLRRVLDRYHLLQVPRHALLVTLVVIVLLVGIVAANFRDLAVTRYFSLFPMVILAGMIERFWTLETEDGTASSFKTLCGTILIATTISLLLSIPAVVAHLFRYPETLGLVMAGQLLIGRYTGYRLSELLRFRDFLQQPPHRPELARVSAERFALGLANLPEDEAVSGSVK
jgi:hypothetical protein